MAELVNVLEWVGWAAAAAVIFCVLELVVMVPRRRRRRYTRMLASTARLERELGLVPAPDYRLGHSGLEAAAQEAARSQVASLTEEERRLLEFELMRSRSQPPPPKR